MNKELFEVENVTKEQALHWLKIFKNDMMYSLNRGEKSISISEQDYDNIKKLNDILNGGK